MTDVLIRDVPGEDLDQIRAAAANLGVSLQSYLRTTVAAQATYLRRQHALARIQQRLDGREGASDQDRAAVLDAVAGEHQQRAQGLGEPEQRRAR